MEHLNTITTQSGVTPSDLNALENKMRSLISLQSSQQGAQTAAVSQMVSQSQRIDNLSNTTIQNPTITGGSITAASIAGTIVNAINTDAATIDNLTSNTVTASNGTFTYATTTNLVATNATTTNLSAVYASSVLSTIGTLNLTNALTPGNGGTGTSTPASLGNLLSWNGTTYQGVATSSLFNTANTSVSGLLSATDWNTFNGKQAAGSYLTALTGDITATGPGSAVATLAMNVSHWWTALQNFGNASTSMLTATSTVWFTSLATPTGTFLAVDTTGKVIATTTPANYFTNSGSNTYLSTGINLLVGTTTSLAPLTIFKTAASAQERISYDATRYAELYTDASGALNLSATGAILNMLNGNMYLCDGGACPTTPVQGYPTFASQGNLVLGNALYTNAVNPATCPSGMIPVPASPANGQQGFCVDKYEAQSSSGNEVSVQGGSPWVSIAQTSARAECKRAGKHLITEKEWQAIANDVENVGFNWNGGVVSTNQMSDGHSDNSPSSALATAADSSPCSDTGQTCDLSTWNSQRRVYKLSNGQYIWDFSGNV